VLAAVLTGPGAVELADVPTPSPGPGEVLVELEGCGVCGSDLPVWEGRPWFAYPREPGSPGHEGWGRVAAVGEGVIGLRPGARVAAISYRADAEYDVAPADAVVALPDALGDAPFPGEALGCAMNVARRSGFAAGQRVAVVGAGFLGALLVQLAARAGAEVVAVSRRPFARALAMRMGASTAHAPGAVPEGEFDRVVEATGQQAALDLCTALVRPRGRLVIAGFHQDGPRTIDLQAWNWKGLDVINAHERDTALYARGVREAAEAVAAGTLDPSPLYTHDFPLARIGDAFATAVARPQRFLKALVWA
jgi:2-desacetyl-2-hydroxyethyl bacteriochlorophyllide A dehydrogenase